MKKKSTNNGKNNTAKHRQKRRADLSRRKSYGITQNHKPPKNSTHQHKLSNKLPEPKEFSFKNIQQPKAKDTAPTKQVSRNCENYKADAIKTIAEASEKPTNEQTLSGINRWYNNPRITGAVAAALLFVTLMAAIIPTSFNVNAEEAEPATANLTMQLAKEYIYAGSRMLAIEDYGLNPGSTPTPTPTATPTETPTVTPTPALKPDLVISNFTATPGSPTDGDQVSFAVTVTNQGQGAMNGFLGVKYQIDGNGTANFTQLTTIIAEIRELAAVKSSGAGRQTTVQRAVVIDAMIDKMKHISRTARVLAIDNPGFDRLFSIPDSKNDQKLAAAAREFVKEAAKFQSDLTAYGLPADFIDALTDDIENLENLLTQGSGARGDQAEATAQIDERVELGMDIVRRLDALARNIYRNDPAKLAKWTTARHIRRTERSKISPVQPTA